MGFADTNAINKYFSANINFGRKVQGDADIASLILRKSGEK